MPLKTPTFWQDKKSILATLLAPLSCLYTAAHRFNMGRQTPYISTLPVICIGNAVAGGSGKTPAALTLINLICANNIAVNPVILTRGYGGKLKGPTSVDPAHMYPDIGDEALMMSRHAPVIIAADRAAGAMLAELSGHDLIVMDDGFQNNTLSKTLSLLVVDAVQGFGNGKILPAGPLREPVADVLKKTDAIISIGGTIDLETDKPVFDAHIQTALNIDITKSYVAFAGLGRPEKFRETLLSLGANIVGWHAFADHHPYSVQNIIELKAEARRYNAALITTEKDFVRIPFYQRDGIETLPITLTFQDEHAVVSFLAERLRG